MMISLPPSIGIVSGGSDNNLCITDIGTGRVLQTLRGHTHHILALAFDTERIVSASRDNTLRYWKWGDKRFQPADKYHLMAPTDSLPLIAKTYDLTLETLMTWNGIKEMKDCYPGMKLIVRKANPDQLTKAELLVYEKQRRQLKGIQQTNKKIQQLQIEKGNIFQNHSRVYKIATDIDPYSLGNRMFSQQKLAGELFPEKDDISTDYTSLGSRIRANTGKRRDFGGPKVKILTTKANENEWGTISDELAMAILETFIEFQAYELVIEEKKVLRDSLSVLGRMNMSNEQKLLNTKLLLGVGSKANKKPGKRKKIEEAMAMWSKPIPEEGEGEGEGDEGKRKEKADGDQVREERRAKKRERKKKKDAENKLLEKEESGGDGGIEGGAGVGAGGDAPSRKDSSSESDEEDSEAHGSASDEENDEEDRDHIFNRKKHRQQHSTPPQQTTEKPLLGDDHSSEGTGSVADDDYGLVLNKRKLSNSSFQSNTSRHSEGGGDPKVLDALTKEGEDDEEKEDEGGEGEEKDKEKRKKKKSISSSTSRRGSSSQSSSRRGSRSFHQPKTSVSSNASSGGGVVSSLHVDDEDGDLLSLLKTDRSTTPYGGQNLDEGDY
jgi:LysM repeat protein